MLLSQVLQRCLARGLQLLDLAAVLAPQARGVLLEPLVHAAPLPGRLARELPREPLPVAPGAALGGGELRTEALGLPPQPYDGLGPRHVGLGEAAPGRLLLNVRRRSQLADRAHGLLLPLRVPPPQRPQTLLPPRRSVARMPTLGLHVRLRRVRNLPQLVLAGAPQIGAAGLVAVAPGVQEDHDLGQLHHFLRELRHGLGPSLCICIVRDRPAGA
mmetsp:Transcript_19757/g.55708  ORF Transcript_19757/g.55708 Transcript_19757/m.55708 type:complete len:215 (+) Transcript_19757:464-1108(+)